MRINHKTTVAISLLFCSSYFLQACSSNSGGTCSCKQVSCPAYKNGNFDQWFPYVQSQQTVYADSANKLINDTIVITTVSSSQSYGAEQGCGSSNSGCNSDKYIYSDALSFGYNSASDWSGNMLDSNYSLMVHGFTVSAKGLNSTGLNSTNMLSQFYSNLSLNGQLYTNVQMIWNSDTTHTKDAVYQVYLQKRTGLLAYRYYPSQTLFVKK